MTHEPLPLVNLIRKLLCDCAGSLHACALKQNLGRVFDVIKIHLSPAFLFKVVGLILLTHCLLLLALFVGVVFGRCFITHYLSVFSSYAVLKCPF